MNKFLGFALALLIISGLSFSVNSVTGCTDITNNTDPLYQLANDLSGANQSSVAGPACVRISASNVILDCNGFDITNNGTAGLTIAIHPNTVSNVTVRNCPSLSGYVYGIYAFGTNNSLFTNLTAFNETNGIFLGTFSFNNTVANNTAYNNSNAGISVGSSNNNSFTGNEVYNNSYGFIFDTNAGNSLSGNNAHNNAHGYRIISSNFTNIIANNATNNSGYGIWLESSRGSLVDSNTVSGNGGDGFFLSVSTFGSPGLNTLSGNTASGNGGHGFDLSFSDGNTIDGNVISGNSGTGLFVSLSSNNNFSGNSISGGTFGINLFSGSTNDTFTGNTVTGATSTAIFAGSGNTFIGNNVSNSFQGVSLGSNNILSGNLVYGIAAFGAFRMESLSNNNVFTDNTAHSSNRGLEILSANNTTVTNMHMYNNSFVDFLTSAEAGDRVSMLSGLIFDRAAGDFVDYTNISITDVLENGSVYSIDHSANPGSAPTANHVSFANKFVNIVNATPGLSIDSITWHWDDSELTSFNENNFELWKLNGSTWTLLNASPDTGANTLSMFDLDNFSTFGIFDSASNVTDCMNITTSGNYVLANDLFGASINGSPLFSGFACIRISASNVLLDCNGFSITNNGTFVSGGIVTEGPAAAAISAVTVQNCVVSDYSQGIVAINTDDSTFTNNTVFDNLFSGITARDGSTGNVFSFNTVFGNDENGIGISDNSDGNTLSGNIAHDNGEDGIELSSVDGNTLGGNNAYNNSVFGFDLVTSDSNSLSDNLAQGNGLSGFRLTTSSDSNTYTNNTASDNGDDGFELSGSTMNTFTGNTAYNHSDGILLATGSSDNVFSGNLIQENSIDGVRIITSSDGNVFADNIIHGSGNRGMAIVDVNQTSMSGDRLYDNLIDFHADGTNITVSLAGVIFDSLSGNLTNYTNLSLDDIVASEYILDHEVQPAALPSGRSSFAGKFIGINALSPNVSIDSATWHWLDSELTNTSNESRFELWQYNGTWSKKNATLDTVANTLSLSPIDSVNIFALSTFAILQNGSIVPPSGDNDGGDGGAGEDPLSISVNVSIDGNLVTVTSDGSPISGANVLVDGLSVGLTNNSGQVSFPGCGDTVVIKAKKDGYADEELSAALVACPACTTNNDCPVTMQCAGNQCAPVPCSCGSVQDHQCVAYQCCADSDCPATETCSGNVCVPLQTVHECIADSDCADNQYCDLPPTVSGGTCREITGCGTVSNHKLTPYECGTGPNCPSCPSGEMCEDNKCVLYAIQCPASGFIGDEITCRLLKEGAPCAECAGSLTDPDGVSRPFSTNAAGEFAFRLDKEGEYKVTLLKDGTTVRSIAVKSLPTTPGTGGEKPTGTGGGDLLLPILLVLALIIVGGVLYWRSRSGKK